MMNRIDEGIQPVGDIFISHVEEDQAIAVELAQGLEANGYSTWYFERDDLPVSYLEQIDEAIEWCRAIVVLVSLDSMSSWQVDREVDAHTKAANTSSLFCGALSTPNFKTVNARGEWPWAQSRHCRFLPTEFHRLFRAW